MAIYYFDSSAIVKRYIAESGTNWVRALHMADATEAIYTVNISQVEVMAAITRKRRMRAISGSAWKKSTDQLRQDFHKHYGVIAVSDAILVKALDLTLNHPLRAYDAMQLASALFIFQALRQVSLDNFIFVSADGNLNTSAQIEGLTVENPNHYPK